MLGDNNKPRDTSCLILDGGASEGNEGELDVGALIGVKTGSTSIVRTHGSDDAHGTSSMSDRLLSGELSNTEEEEGDPEEEEHGAEGDGRLVGGDEHDEGEGEPGHQVDSKSIVELIGRGVSGEDTGRWPEDEGKREPETAIGRESSGTEGVTGRELPHACKKLDETSNADGHRDDQVRGGDVTSIDVEERQDQRGGGEREETERAGVTELPVVDGETRLRDINTAASVGASNGERVGLDVSEVVAAVESCVLVSGGHWKLMKC
jgi:hypothetical protein